MAAKKGTKKKTTGRRRKPDPVSDRQYMDQSGAPQPDENFLEQKAEEDRLDAKARHLQDALAAVRTNANLVAKSWAHGHASQTDSIKIACLEEIASLCQKMRTRALKAIREHASEDRNVQA